MTRASIIIFVFIVLVASCNTQRNPEYLPQATGKSGDMIVIMDSIQRKGPLGQKLSSILQAEVRGLPREEPMFNVIWVHPNKKIRLLTQIRNLVYVFTLDQKSPGSRLIREDFSPETLQKIKSDTSFFISTNENEYSRGQKVMYLFGATEESLIRHIEDNEKKITDYFNEAEKNRMQSALYKTRTTKSITDFLRNQQQIELRIPVGYKLAQKEDDFAWFRQIDADADKDVFISWKSYESEYQLMPDSLIEWREKITKKYIYEDPAIPNSYLVTEQEVPLNPVRAKQVNFNGQFAMELRGLWRTNNFSMGGPFVAYGLVDRPRNLIYYIEGFTYSPGKDQREIIRELETILWTFKTSENLNASAQ